MRLCRFNDDKLGLVEGDIVRDVTATLDVIPPVRLPFPWAIAWSPISASCGIVSSSSPPMPRSTSSPMSACSAPSPIREAMAAPANYRLHVELDTKDPTVDAGVHRAQLIDMEAPTEKLGLFLKAQSSLVSPSEGVLVPPGTRVDHEVELAVIIGRQARNIQRTDALGYVAGYCIGLHDGPRHRGSQLPEITRLVHGARTLARHR